jgi:hypothetical protein
VPQEGTKVTGEVQQPARPENSEHTKTSIPRRLLPPLLSSLQDEAYIGSGETASVIDAINRRAIDSSNGLPVLILDNPNNPILHPGA